MIPFYELKREETRISNITNLTFPAHLHKSVEMVYVITGEQAVTIDGVLTVLKQGDVAFVFPNQVHFYEATSCEATLALVSPNIFGELAVKMQNMLPVSQILRSEEISAIMRAEFLEISDCEKTAPIVKNALLCVLFARFIDAVGLKSSSVPAQSDLPGKAIMYISNNFKQPLSLVMLAKQLNVSKFHLSRTLRACVSMGFCEYVNCLRADYAKTLLKSTNMNVVEIAMECGFENLRTFNRAFKAYVGLSPRDFKKQ